MTFIVERIRKAQERVDRVITTLHVGLDRFRTVRPGTDERIDLELRELRFGRRGKEEAVLVDTDSGREIITDADRIRKKGRIGGLRITAVEIPEGYPVVGGQEHPRVSPARPGKELSLLSVDPDELVTGREYVLRFRGRCERTTFDTEAVLRDQGLRSLEFDIDNTVRTTIQKTHVVRDPNNLGVTIYPEQTENPDALVFVQSGRLIAALR